METGIDDHDLHLLVARAKGGDRIALEGVVRAVQDDVFDLALRMLGHVEDASDASQEILVRLVTKLDSFRGESRFSNLGIPGRGACPVELPDALAATGN